MSERLPVTFSAVSAAPRPLGRPPRIDRESVVAVALNIADQYGLDRLTLPAVAAELGVTRTALYRVVGGAADLAQIVITAVLDEMAAQLRSPAGWREAMLQYARAMHSALLIHPALFDAYRTRLVHAPRMDERRDAVFESLLGAGLDPDAAIDVYAAVHAFVVGYAALEHRRRTLTRDEYERLPTRESVAAVHRRLPDRYYAAESFEQGLQIVVAGAAARIADAHRA